MTGMRQGSRTERGSNWEEGGAGVGAEVGAGVGAEP